MRTLVEEEEGDDEDASKPSDPSKNVLTLENLRLMTSIPLGDSAKFNRKLSFSNFNEDSNDMMSQLDDASDSMSEVSALEDFDEIKFLKH